MWKNEEYKIKVEKRLFCPMLVREINLKYCQDCNHHNGREKDGAVYEEVVLCEYRKIEEG